MSGTRVVIMAGGTGGHIFPALAVADRLRELGAQVTWLGSQYGLETKLVPAHGYELDAIDVAGLRGKGLLRWVTAPLQLTRALTQAYAMLRKRNPQVVLGLGGFASGPGGVAARLQRIPLAIHEQNAVAGMTNRLLSRIAQRVMQAFPGALSSRSGVEQTGNPVRVSIAALASPKERWAQRSGAIRLLVLGGSQGARALNETVPASLPADPGRFAIRHQAGRGSAGVTAEAYAKAGVVAEVAEFIDDMAEAYGWADLVICRAGALTVAELAAAGVPAILVPYPHAVDDHQTRNARFLTDADAGWLVPQAELADTLPALLLARSESREELLPYAQRARALALPDATQRVAAVCMELAGGVAA